MTLEAFEADAKRLIDPVAELEKIASGFEFTEGPVWSFRHHHLTFVDLAGDAMYRWDQTSGTEVLRKPSEHAVWPTTARGHWSPASTALGGSPERWEAPLRRSSTGTVANGSTPPT